MASVRIVMRHGEKQDVHFLRDLVRHTGPGRAGVSIEEDPPPLSRYVAGWGRVGDSSVIALDDETHVTVGAAWYRSFTADEPGFAFIDEATPELTVGVVPSRRGQGVGPQLVAAIVERARSQGIPALSLSSLQDAALIELFESCGFRIVGGKGSAVTMKIDLL